MAVIHGVASWPGAISVVSCVYTISHGCAPATAVMTILPQKDYPQQHGNLVIYDGQGYVTIPNCRLDNIKVSKDEGGTLWHLEIVDRRWRWRNLGLLHGLYNQRDYHNLFIIWQVRRCVQLVSLCLDAMGETSYDILVPNTTLPPINWDYVNPAKALEELAESLGCRVVYRLDTDTVAVVPLGVGKRELPSGSIAKEGPQATSPEIPDSLMLIGAPIRYQCRFRLTAVGEEWDGSIREIDQLSYAPDVSVGESKRHKVDVVPSFVQIGNKFTITINGEADVVFVATAATVASVVAGLVAAINASIDPVIKNRITAKDNGSKLTLTGEKDGTPFVIATRGEVNTGPAVGLGGGEVANGPDMEWEIVQQGVVSTNHWSSCPPPLYANVKATPQLTHIQARDKAAKSVMKWYAIMNIDTGTRLYPALVPGFGRLLRIFQIIPEPTKVEQIVPKKNDEFIKDKIEGRPINRHFYDGYTRDVPAEVFGAHFKPNSGAIFTRGVDKENTTEDGPVIVPFEIDPTNMVVKFSSPVYFMRNGKSCEPADLVLETAVQVRDPVTNAVVRYIREYSPPGPKVGTGPAVFRHEDIRQWYVGTYDKHGNLLKVDTNLNWQGGQNFLLGGVEAQAQHYIIGHFRQYEVREALDREYNGIVPIALDGSIHQVTWTVGPQGCSTRASLHSEHSTYIPTYPERLRLVFIPPAAQNVAPGGIRPENVKPGTMLGAKLER